MDDELAEIRETLRRWLDNEVWPAVIRLEHADEYPVRLVDQMRDFGLFGATIPQNYGGLGLRAEFYAEVVAMISECGCR